jgi:two-component system LytT family response regulator
MKTLIVDDERLARQRLARLLLREADVELLGQCQNVQQARELMTRDAVDLLFVDVQMPRASGFELVKSATAQAAPAIVFVTAFEQYAVQAFEVKACDYLLKPIADARLRVAVGRAREFLQLRDGAQGAEAAWEETRVGEAEPQLDAVLVRTNAKVLRIKLETIDWIEADGNYVQLHVEGKAHLLRETLSAFEARLPPKRFARIHRNAIANLDRIVAFHPTVSGDFSVALRDGTQLRMSRSYRGRIRDLFGNPI